MTTTQIKKLATAPDLYITWTDYHQTDSYGIGHTTHAPGKIRTSPADGIQYDNVGQLRGHGDVLKPSKRISTLWGRGYRPAIVSLESGTYHTMARGGVPALACVRHKSVANSRYEQWLKHGGWPQWALGGCDWCTSTHRYWAVGDILTADEHLYIDLVLLDSGLGDAWIEQRVYE